MFLPHLGFHVHEVQAFGVDPHIDPDDLVGTGAGLGVDLAGKKGSSVGGNVPAVLQEEALKVLHFFTHSLTGAQTLRNQHRQKGEIRHSIKKSLFFIQASYLQNSPI